MVHSIPDVIQLVKNYIIGKLNLYSNIFTYTESSSTSTKAYVAGEKLIYNLALYQASVDIPRDTLLEPGTNIEASDDILTIINSKSKKPTLLTRILLPGVTTLTFPITDSNDLLVDFFTDAGIGYIDLDASVSGQVTLTFEPQSVNVTVYCVIQEL